MEYPSYLNLYKSGELEERIEKAYRILSCCTLCPNLCKVSRLEKNGICSSATRCRSGILPIISEACAHFGEEPPVTGVKGSGTIFFSNCTLKCKYCQNYQISQEGIGEEISEKELADKMLYLQKSGCHNINLVTPTHFVPQILKALSIAIEHGLNIPIVYNTSGYESLDTLKLLDCVIDIYLPDIKYSDDENSFKYSGTKNYVSNNRIAIKEMFRQVGVLNKDKRGIAVKGLIIRHLVLPERISGSFESLKFLVEEISRDVTISLMAQYHPCYKASEFPEINRKITYSEYREVINEAENLEFTNLPIAQYIDSSEVYIPDFSLDTPFSDFCGS